MRKAMTRPPAPKATDPGQPAAGQPGGNRPATADVAELRAQLREAHETIEAIRDGAVDSLVIGRPDGSRSTPSPPRTAPIG